MKTLGITWRPVAFFLLIRAVHEKSFPELGKEMDVTSLRQAHFFWFIVREFLVVCAEGGHFDSYAGLEISSSVSSPVSNKDKIKKLATEKMEGIEERLKIDITAFGALYRKHLFAQIAAPVEEVAAPMEEENEEGASF